MIKTKSTRRKLFNAMKEKPLSITEVMEITGKPRKASQTIIHSMIHSGYKIKVASCWHNTTYSLEDGAEPHKFFYEKVYDKMAIDNPREWWEMRELVGIFGKRRDAIRKALMTINKNICGVECEYKKGSTSKYRLLDGD